MVPGTVIRVPAGTTPGDLIAYCESRGILVEA